MKTFFTAVAAAATGLLIAGNTFAPQAAHAAVPNGEFDVRTEGVKLSGFKADFGTTVFTIDRTEGAVAVNCSTGDYTYTDMSDKGFKVLDKALTVICD